MRFIKTLIKRLIGVQRARRARQLLTRIRHFGFKRYCSICRAHLRRFSPFGAHAESQCPVCGSRERHRLIYLYLQSRTNLLDGRCRTMLDVAPDASLEGFFRSVPALRYVSGDIGPRESTVKMDLCRLPFADHAFEVIYCSHVLEHIRDDRTAMRELHRVLAPEGWAILQVPIGAGPTQEDPTIVDPGERERLYGQQDHVRLYGADYVQRLEQAGFTVTIDWFAQSFGADERQRLGIEESEGIYVCRRLNPESN